VIILALDTSGSSGSVALLEGPLVLGELALDAERRSAQTLAPAIVALLSSAKVEPSQVELVATTIGPGSFTGLRVGVTTAKTFAYAVGAEVIGVSTLEAIAHGLPDELLAGQGGDIQAVLDAQRKELFVGKFLRETGRLTRIEPDHIVPSTDWLAGLQPGTIVTGTGLARLESQLPAGVVAAPVNYREPRAAIVGRLAWHDYQAGRRDDLWKLAPIYLRPSYAEEKVKKPQSGPNLVPERRD
jgi:tRNA threonylcarbamoyladenosine biosynthesis protein TsaB